MNPDQPPKTPAQLSDAATLRAIVEACHNSLFYPPARVMADLKAKVDQIRQQYPPTTK